MTSGSNLTHHWEDKGELKLTDQLMKYPFYQGCPGYFKDFAGSGVLLD